MTPTPTYSETIIEAAGVRSLVWVEDRLVDWVAGGTVYQLDGSKLTARVNFAYPFDAVVATPDGEYAVIYTRFGTKGLLLRDGKVLRELNRSFYHATAYEYPICLVSAQSRTLVVHCPEEYNRLEIEDASTGERLTTRSSPTSDFFHSRLSVSPGGKYILSAGWVWHPWDAVVYYDLERALREPSHLDSLDLGLPCSRNVCLAEEASACWLTDSVAVVTGGPEPEDPDEAAEEASLRLLPNGVAVYDVPAQTISSACVLGEPAGTVMRVGLTHVMSFYQHPRLLRLSDGFVEFTLPAISTGDQLSSILGKGPVPPPLALDPESARFAVAQSDGIHVISVRLAP